MATYPGHIGPHRAQIGSYRAHIFLPPRQTRLNARIMRTAASTCKGNGMETRSERSV